MWAALWGRIKRLVRPLSGRTPAQRQGRETDVAVDPTQPAPMADEPFVGRIGGEDAGFGAETTATTGENGPGSPRA